MYSQLHDNNINNYNPLLNVHTKKHNCSVQITCNSKSTPVTNNVSHESGETKLAFLNIGGFEPKLKIPEFHIFINQYDIIGLVETKLNKHSIKVNDKNEDTTSIPGYTLIHKFRKSRSAWDSGGIAIAVKNSIKEKFEIKTINSSANDNTLWCKFSNYFKDSDEPLIIGVTYISPQGSPYSSQHCFTDIETEYLNNFVNSKYCLLMGDFNSHIKNNPDLVCQFDDSETNEMIVNSMAEQMNIYNELEKLSMPTTRITHCKQPSNTWGRYFLELVKSLNCPSVII